MEKKRQDRKKEEPSFIGYIDKLVSIPTDMMSDGGHSNHSGGGGKESKKPQQKEGLKSKLNPMKMMKGVTNVLHITKDDKKEKTKEVENSKTSTQTSLQPPPNPYALEMAKDEDEKKSNRSNLSQEDEELDKPLDHNFNCAEDVSAFFTKVGQLMKNPQISSKVRPEYLTTDENLILEELMHKRQNDYINLNKEIYSSFSKLFFYIQYIHALVSQQIPMYTSYKGTFVSLFGAHLSVAKQNEQLALRNTKLEATTKTQKDQIKQLEQKCNNCYTQIFNLTHTLNQLETDYNLVNKERRRIENLMTKQ